MTHDDTVVQALIDHQRRDPGSCVCGWGPIGRSHAEHVAGIVRPLIEAEVRAIAAAGIAGLPAQSYRHVDGCPGGPGKRGLCDCAQVPLIDRASALAIVRGES